VQEKRVPKCDTLIRNVQILDGSGGEPRLGSVAIDGDFIAGIGDFSDDRAKSIVDGEGKMLAPGFIDAHTHDDLFVIRAPEMVPKLSQGVTTVIVGNCGISAAPVQLTGNPPEPMNLLGETNTFHYPKFAEYVNAVASAQPAVNVAALVGHTSLRNNHMDRLDRTATADEIAAMQAQLCESLEQGGLGLSTGLAYSSANSASTEEVAALCEPLFDAGAIYTTHLRTESRLILDAMQEAFHIGQIARVPVIISHLKCAGLDNWGRSVEVLQSLEKAAKGHSIGWDCYPYAASSTILSLSQVDDRIAITITWSTPHPEMTGKTLAQIAASWGTTQIEAAQRLQPAGAIYYCMSQDDVRRILRHPGTMIGSDGLPNDQFPHPRLWGTFPRVLAYYCREQKLFSLGEAVRKMTSLTAQRFGLSNRGWIREGYAADLVLFDAQTVQDTASFEDPIKPAIGINAAWVNGELSYWKWSPTGQRAGHFLRRQNTQS
jgi:N-acyl-D-aspartate/D-glutamate deacylase